MCISVLDGKGYFFKKDFLLISQASMLPEDIPRSLKTMLSFDVHQTWKSPTDRHHLEHSPWFSYAVKQICDLPFVYEECPSDFV